MFLLHHSFKLDIKDILFFPLSFQYKIITSKRRYWVIEFIFWSENIYQKLKENGPRKKQKNKLVLYLKVSIKSSVSPITNKCVGTSFGNTSSLLGIVLVEIILHYTHTWKGKNVEQKVPIQWIYQFNRYEFKMYQ